MPAEQSDSGADGLSRRRGKVFGIGLSRTGTRSLAAALSRLGFRAGHYDAALRAMTIADGEVVPDFDLIDAWEALTDICKCEGLTLHELCSLVDNNRHGSSRTSAVRAFIVTYFRTLARDHGALVGGTASAILPGLASRR